MKPCHKPKTRIMSESICCQGKKVYLIGANFDTGNGQLSDRQTKLAKPE